MWQNRTEGSNPSLSASPLTRGPADPGSGPSARLTGLGLQSRRINGEMTERSKVRAWRARVPLKGTVGSNPTLSATPNLLHSRARRRSLAAAVPRSVLTRP